MPNRKIWGGLTLSVCLALGGSARAAESRGTGDKTQLTYFGHSAFRITTPSGKVLLIDPWIANPENPQGPADLAAMDRVDLILISHGHFDHVGDALAIAQKTHAPLVATFDLGQALVQQLNFPKDQAGFGTLGNIGGELDLLDGEVKVLFVPAVHSSTVAEPSGAQHAAGTPTGFVISIRGGPTIYHTGDTDLFSDMALIPKFHKVDVMLACIGDHFTMGPERAAEATRLVSPRVVVPMHYGTFPVLTGTPDTFQRELKRHRVTSKLKVMQPHESMTL